MTRGNGTTAAPTAAELAEQIGQLKAEVAEVRADVKASAHVTAELAAQTRQWTDFTKLLRDQLRIASSHVERFTAILRR